MVSATAVTAVGSAVGVASGSTSQSPEVAATPLDSTVVADVYEDQTIQVQTESLARQADAQAISADITAKKNAEVEARQKAASDALAKKAAAEEVARQERQEAELAASRSASRTSVQSSYSVSEIQAIARQMVAGEQFQCMSAIVDHESSWNYQAVNASSGAYGLFQALPGSKMASAGSDWQVNPRTQIKWGLNYMNDRYGGACEAWSFWQANHWY